MPGSRNTSRPNLGTVMVFCAATRCTDGPGAPAWASVAPNGAVAATVHPATAMAAYRNLHRGLFMALFSSAVGLIPLRRDWPASTAAASARGDSGPGRERGVSPRPRARLPKTTDAGRETAVAFPKGRYW